MKYKLKYLILSVFVAFLLSGCVVSDCELGNGSVENEVRTLPYFNGISSSGNFDVYFDYSDTSEVTISCESNLMKYIETVVLDDELKIRTPSFIDLKPTKNIELYVRGPQIESIKLSGLGLVQTDSLNSKSLKLELSGSGKIVTDFYGENFYTNISGSGLIDAFAQCDNYTLSISGLGRIDLSGRAAYAECEILGMGSVKAYDFLVSNADVCICGLGNLFLNIEEALNAKISGGGSIHYIGYPVIESVVSGSGRLIDEN